MESESRAAPISERSTKRGSDSAAITLQGSEAVELAETLAEWRELVAKS